MAHRSVTNPVTAAGSLSPVAAAPVFVPNLSQRSTSAFPSHPANQVSGFYTAQTVGRPQAGQAAYQQATHGHQFQVKFGSVSLQTDRSKVKPSQSVSSMISLAFESGRVMLDARYCEKGCLRATSGADRNLSYLLLFQQLVNKGSSPSPLASEPMIGASGNMVAPSPVQTGIIGGSYATIAPPGHQRRSDEYGYAQSPFLPKQMNYSTKTPTTQQQDAMRSTQYSQQYLMGPKMSSSPAANTYSLPQSLPAQGNLTPSTQPLRFTQTQSHMKTFEQAERVKQMNQYRQVQGMLSRPYTG